MQHVKDFLNVLDFLVGTLWSITIIDVMPIILTGSILDKSLLDPASTINLLIAIAGLIYLIVRIIQLINIVIKNYKMSKLEIKLKEQEIISMEIKNFNDGINTELKEKSK